MSDPVDQTWQSARLRAVLEEVPALVAVMRGPDLIVEFANLRRRRLTGTPEVVGRPAPELLAPVGDRPGMARFLRELRHVVTTGETVTGWEAAAEFPGVDGPTYWDYVMIPLRDAPGEPPSSVVLHATEVTRLVEARRRAAEAEHRFTTLFDANVTGVTITDEAVLHEANDAFLQMIGRTREDLAAGLRWTDITAPESRAADEQAIALLRSTGAVPAYEKSYVRPDGTRVPVLISGSRLQSDPLRILATAFDLSERQAVEREVATLLERERDARFAAELAGARTSRLQEITAALSASNSPDEIARAVLHQALEDLSASAGLLVRGTADLRLTHAVGVPRERVEQWQAYPATLPAVLRSAMAGTHPVTLVSAGVIAAEAPDLVPAGAVVAVPLAAGGRTLGALAVVFREPRALDAEDEEFLLVLARQAGAALDRAQLYENRAYVARKLQEGLLPQRLAEAPGLETGVVYESISGGGEVGGDFYDFLETGTGAWVLTIGDVVGKGTDAAVVTGLARHTVRAIARVRQDPAEILDFLNGALLRHAGPPAFCTVGCAVVEAAADGAFEVRIASGGHPAPLLLRPSGAVEPVNATGTLLGIPGRPEFDIARVRLERGDALVFYTDGVTDARRPGRERFGEARLVEALRGSAGGTAVQVARAVEDAVRAHHPGESADDRAIVVLRVTPPTG